MASAARGYCATHTSNVLACWKQEAQQQVLVRCYDIVHHSQNSRHSVARTLSSYWHGHRRWLCLCSQRLHGADDLTSLVDHGAAARAQGQEAGPGNNITPACILQQLNLALCLTNMNGSSPNGECSLLTCCSCCTQGVHSAQCVSGSELKCPRSQTALHVLLRRSTKVLD